MSIRIDVTHEEKKNDLTTISAYFNGSDVVCWQVTMSDQMIQNTKDKVQKALDARKDWASIMYEEIGKRMRLSKPTEEPMKADYLNATEHLIAICHKWKELSGLREVPVQKDLKEDLKKIRAK